jgi:hypothetical protein
MHSLSPGFRKDRPFRAAASTTGNGALH